MVHKLKNNIRITQRAIIQSGTFLGAGKGRATPCAEALVLGGLCCHRTPHRPSRFKLLLVTLKLSAICETVAASCSFLSRLPAKPLPACSSSNTVFNTTVEDSIFFTAALICSRFVARTPLKAPANWFICSVNITRLLPEWTSAGLFEDTSASSVSTVLRARSETTRILTTATDRFVS